MNQPNEAVLFPELLTPEEQKTFQALVAADPALAEAVRFWESARIGVHGRLNQLLADRNLLVCYALEQAGTGDLLDQEEAEALAGAKAGIEEAIRKHPGLADIVRRIQQDAVVFEACWREHHGDAREQPAAPVRRDREATPHAARARRLSRWPWRVAVGVTLAAFVGMLTMVWQRDGSYEVAVTGAGGTRVIALADGSTVRLLEHSELSYISSEDKTEPARRTRLKGKAFFEVTPGKEVFTVETSTAVTTVLGTAFGVAADEAETEVILARGRVALAPAASPDRMVTLSSGQRSRVAAGALPSTPENVNVAEALEWTGLFIFNATPLEQIAAVLARHYSVSVSVDDALEQEEVTGTFERSRPVEEILTPLAATLGASVEGNAQAGFRVIARGK